MLLDRKQLLEHEISKLTKEAAKMYLAMMQNTGVGYLATRTAEYRHTVSRLHELKSDLAIVEHLMEEGELHLK